MDVSGQIRAKGLKATTSRLNVIEVLSVEPQAYSHAELELLFNNMDRVTLYRVLNDFEEVGLVHKIIDAEGVTRFAMCRHTCPGEHHIDEHVHFNCETCHKMYCLENVYAPRIKMPDGFVAKGLQTLIYGVCGNCSAL